MIKKIGVVMAFFGAIGVASAQEQENKNLTLFTLGMESVQYSEDTGAGITASGKSMVNLTQRSSGYTSVNDDLGFYITTTSSLMANQSAETWTMSPYGVVQQNQRKVILTDLALDSAWNLGSGFQMTGGLAMNTMSFSRSGFSYQQGTRGVATTVANGNPILQSNGKAIKNSTKQPLYFSPVGVNDTYGSIQRLSANPGGDVGRQSGAVFEDSTTILAKVGLRYDTFFSGDEGFRVLGGVSAGIPLFYYVTNSNYPNTSWTSSFKGFNLHADLGVGFQIKDNFDFVVLGSGDYRFRAKTSTDPITGGLVPNATVTIFRATAGLSWSF